MSVDASRHASALAGRRLPPVGTLLVASMGVVMAGGIYLASHLPHAPSMAPAYGLLGLAGVLLLVAILLLARLQEFNWEVFWRVGGWSVLAYVVIAGMLEYVFVLDHTRGSVLAVLTLMLVAFALDVPLLFAFSVARFQARGLDDA